MANRPISHKETKAWEFAQEKHKGQVRKFVNKSYFDAHVQKVNGIVKLYTTDENTLCSALLHDVVEDCYDDKLEGYNDIEQEFDQSQETVEPSETATPTALRCLLSHVARA